VKQLPYFRDGWQASLERYFREYVKTLPDGSVVQRVLPEAILAAVEGILIEDWAVILSGVRQPVLLINAQDPYGPSEAAPFLPSEQVMATVAALSNCSYASVRGNHVTMIFGEHAHQVAAAIRKFVVEIDEVCPSTLSY
jgi:hypothetical protein